MNSGRHEYILEYILRLAQVSPTETLKLYGALYPQSLAPADVLARVDLQDKAKALVRTLSGGQKQRLALPRRSEGYRLQGARIPRPFLRPAGSMLRSLTSRVPTGIITPCLVECAPARGSNFVF